MTTEELKRSCDEEFKKIDRITDELFSVYRPDKTDYTIVEQAAVAAFTVNIYRGFENILKQMLIFDKLDIADSPDWHEKMLKKAGEIGILPPELFKTFSRYLAFRNYFIYTYIFDIKWGELKALVEAVQNIIVKFKTEVEEYIQTI
ncbi:MAG TPA: hypothetical protein ENG95_02750 [Nitrospirae bacterium]|nr:hypothetical protein BMS3Abin10_02088 [bacterium BMS3Abin10]GBE37978.1 hypothetical protein BMS3Bbin08_00577 [bacterium BMS3Bbin08]HDK81759.1 hypothetical protein [Nitrospirota bacterium]HDO25551.1 hypothetical protein [Nitrospirota bacterium]